MRINLIIFFFKTLDRSRGGVVRVGYYNEDFQRNYRCGPTLSSNMVCIPRTRMNCRHPIMGRYVSIQLEGKEEYLNLCEIEVFADG